MAVFYTGILACAQILQADEILYTLADLAMDNKNLPAGVWTDANTLFGIAVGTALAFQNVGGTPVVGNLSATQPAPGQLDGFVAQQYDYRTVQAGSAKLWLRPLFGNGTVVGEAV